MRKILHFVVLFLTLSCMALTPTFAQNTVNVNTANLEELKTLNGVGQARAQDILKHREKYGPFRSYDDLKKVRGIKDRIVEANKARITFGDQMGQPHHDGNGAPKTKTATGAH